MIALACPQCKSTGIVPAPSSSMKLFKCIDCKMELDMWQVLWFVLPDIRKEDNEKEAENTA